MKKIVEDNEAGLISLIGEQVEVWCANYIYAGKLTGVNNNCIELEDVKVVYETGELTAKTWKDAQSTGGSRLIMVSAIESIGKTNKK